MNLQLEKANGISILKISGEVDKKATSIIRAGITKLMKDGKDKIIVDLQKVEKLNDDFVIEIDSLAKLAKELSGQIVVATTPAATVDKINKIVSPPSFQTAPTLQAAVDLFQKNKGAPPTEVVAPKSAEELTAVVAEQEKKIKALEKQISLMDPAEIRNLRKENESVRELNRQLEAQITKFISERRIPPDFEAVEEKIESYERQLKTISESQQASSHGKK